MKLAPSSSPGDPFVDFINVAGREIENPTLDELAMLESQLKAGALLSFSLERQSDRDAGLDFRSNGEFYAIVGMEDSKQRGTYAFCYLDRSKGSQMVAFGQEYYPHYCTTDNVDDVMAVARTYFRTGELDRSVTWHVSRRGVGRRLEDIPDSEILGKLKVT